jgi:hypothetical protein
MFAFLFQGFNVIKDVKYTINENLTQQKATVENIGSVFDWYGITIVDSIVKNNIGILTTEETIKILKEEQVKKNKLLKQYYSTVTDEESFYVDKLKRHDMDVDDFLNKVYASKTSIGPSMISEMYKLTDPAVALINEILNAKTRYTDQNSQKIQEEIKQFEKFLYCVGVLGAVIVLPLLFKREKREREKLTIRIQEIKKRGDREKLCV